MNDDNFIRYRRRTNQAGFTLLELMIVCAIIAILASIAYPSYTRYITRTHRVAAEGCLSEYANYMERFYTTNLNYSKDISSGNKLKDNFPVLDCASASQTGDNYQYTLASATSTAYTVDATPVGTQLARDTECGTLSLNQAGQRGKTGTGTIEKCW